jgi:hypothetical protein
VFSCSRCAEAQAGRMISDLPAMHDTSLNEHSFALKGDGRDTSRADRAGKPSTSHLPSFGSPSPFCRECTTNQSMIVNLLANYLPADSVNLCPEFYLRKDPNYASLQDDLPHYVASLHQRYPPVCYRCQPAVTDALRKADQKAQGEAWSYALKRGSEKIQSRRNEGEKLLAVLVWRLRGALFCVGTAVHWLLDLAGESTCFVRADVQPACCLIDCIGSSTLILESCHRSDCFGSSTYCPSAGWCGTPTGSEPSDPGTRRGPLVGRPGS